jgi:hypothetical protein
MCTDFTDLNKCCPMDYFPLAIIDKIIDYAVGCEKMALLDYFLNYHQICLHKEGEEKISFITPFSTYCYLRITKATLNKLVVRNVFPYVDDIIIASKKKIAYISDFTGTFANMHEARPKMNPDKCMFGVIRGKVLGCLVSLRGIEVNPDKMRAILQMQPPQSRMVIQKLTGRIIALKKFRAKLVE